MDDFYEFLRLFLVEEGAVISMGVYIGASPKIIDRSTGEITFGKVPAYSVVVQLVYFFYL